MTRPPSFLPSPLYLQAGSHPLLLTRAQNLNTRSAKSQNKTRYNQASTLQVVPLRSHSLTRVCKMAPNPNHRFRNPRILCTESPSPRSYLVSNRKAKQSPPPPPPPRFFTFRNPSLLSEMRWERTRLLDRFQEKLLKQGLLYALAARGSSSSLGRPK
jgi:hypothetical protein